jgi:hypothetical protein
VSPQIRRAARWLATFLGLMAVLQVMSGALPRENRIRIDLPPEVTVTRVVMEISDLAGELLRIANLGAPIPNPPSLEYVVNLPPGEYCLSTTYELRRPMDLDKDHGTGSTVMGVRHQIRLEGEDHHLPPPQHEAK